ncbi:MAG: sugar-transfer associated ATP-grasp domain-containing protein [Candidatus Woesebacteria bacterium]|jgi:alpha-L-glutamate ligase-like protein
MKISHILGKNSRNMLFSYPYNKIKGKSIASSKIRTKRYLKEGGVPVPEIYGRFTKPQHILTFDWTSLPSAFALKPNKGLGGEGIIVIKRRAKDPLKKGKYLKDTWITTDRRKLSIEDLKLHTMAILEGAYSIRNVPDIAFIEEFIGRHKAFRKYAYRGTPDIRVIVFNKVPVMAMLRLPTRESGGRANLHQGAIAVGVDIATGITTHAYWKGEYIRHKPGTKRKLHGIKIPKWTKMLKIAVACQEVTTLGYMGADIVLHPEKGPMVLEINYMPGLQIQMANKAGLRKRLERVEDLRVRDADHGVKIAKALFASSFADRVKAEEGIRTISAFEKITIKGLRKDLKRKKVVAKIDTGAWRTSVSEKLAGELGLLEKDNILWEKRVVSSLGEEKRPVINLTFWLAGRKITTPASVSKRMALKFPVIIGRKNLKGMLVNPEVSADQKRELVKEVQG